MSKKTVVITGLATLVAGIVIGSSGSASSDVPAAQPQVKTVTKTRTVTDRVEVTPQSCLRAIDAADQIRSSASDYTDITIQLMDVNAKWPGLMKRTLTAGMNMDVAAVQNITNTVRGMNSDMDGITSDIDGLASDLRPIVRKFNNASASCRAQG